VSMTAWTRVGPTASSCSRSKPLLDLHSHTRPGRAPIGRDPGAAARVNDAWR
jgi:hypothetical protein